MLKCLIYDQKTSKNWPYLSSRFCVNTLQNAIYFFSRKIFRIDGKLNFYRIMLLVSGKIWQPNFKIFPNSLRNWDAWLFVWERI